MNRALDTFVLRFVRILCLVLLSFLTLSSPLRAEQNRGDPKFNFAWRPAPSWESVDGNFALKLRGRLYFDNAWINDDDGTTDINATEFRAARLGLDGSAWKILKYRLEFDFAGRETNVRDGWIQFVGGPVDVKIGQFELAPALDEATSSQYGTFMERASFTDAFAFSRQLGVLLKKSGKDWQVQVAAFKGAASDEGDNAETTLAARASISPKFGNIQFHFGGAFRYRDKDSDQPDFKYSQRPHQHLSAKFLGTGSIAGSDRFFGLETAAIAGPIAFQGEWGWLSANLSNSFKALNPGLSDPTFKGGYVSASYFLTGETRNYKASNGAFSGTKVLRPLHQGGPGAWQIGIRFDHIDLSDNGIFGGQQDTVILALNWHLNNNTRLMFNYSHSDIKKAFLVSALNGPDGANDVDAFGIRAQINW